MPTGLRAGAARTAALALALGWLVAARGAAAGPPAPTAATDASSRPSPAAAAAPAATAAPPLASIRSPYAAISGVILSLWVALDGGYFTQEGLEATIELISTAPTLTQAMLAGEVAMAYSGLEASVSATPAGTDVVILGAGTDR